MHRVKCKTTEGGVNLLKVVASDQDRYSATELSAKPPKVVVSDEDRYSATE